MAKVTYRKKKLFPLYAASDEAKINPILDALKAQGFPIAADGETPNKGGVMLLFLSVRIQRSIVTLTISHITFCIPYVILTVIPKLRQLDDNVAEAALDLGGVRNLPAAACQGKGCKREKNQ